MKKYDTQIFRVLKTDNAMDFTMITHRFVGFFLYPKTYIKFKNGEDIKKKRSATKTFMFYKKPQTCILLPTLKLQYFYYLGRQGVTSDKKTQRNKQKKLVELDLAGASWYTKYLSCIFPRDSKYY